jgi:hypothetical protein
MTKSGRRTVVVEDVDPENHLGGHLSVRVDDEARIVR